MFFRPICKFCDHPHCSVDADICPRCGHADPNPGLSSRIDRVISGLMLAAYILFLGAVFVVPGWLMHPHIGVGIALFFMLCASITVIKAVWYAFDPTFTIVRAVRSTH